MKKNKPVKLRIGRGVMCYNLPKAAKRKIRKDLTFDNPEYVQAEKQGRYVSSDVDPTIELFVSSKKKWWIPRGYISYLMRWIKENKIERIISLCP